MGGEGQPQTQSAIFTRYVQFGMDLQAAITAPRWLLGKTWGADTTSLKLEKRFDHDIVQALAKAGHDVELLPEFSSLVGHAGAVVLHPDGLVETATDPRADGAALSF
jgi:gamma-glutamyltranspeptidase/glutathione hydrolase